MEGIVVKVVGLDEVGRWVYKVLVDDGVVDFVFYGVVKVGVGIGFEKVWGDVGFVNYCF